MLPVLPAHGALGNLDEVVFLVIGFIFLGMMGMSWFRSQRIPAEDDTENKQNNPDEAHAEHFELK